MLRKEVVKSSSTRTWQFLVQTWRRLLRKEEILTSKNRCCKNVCFFFISIIFLSDTNNENDFEDGEIKNAWLVRWCCTHDFFFRKQKKTYFLAFLHFLEVDVFNEDRGKDSLSQRSGGAYCGIQRFVSIFNSQM